MNLKSAMALAFGLAVAGVSHAATELVIATVNNGHMIEMQKLTKFFEQANPDIKVKWVTLEEGVLRQRVTTDIATKGGQFDIMTIGMYETPIWGKKGWLQELKPDGSYDVDDLLPAMRQGLSVDGKLYAAPFYGESSMLMYRKDLADKAGVKLSERPTWDQVKELAAKIHNPPGVYGICLRGKPGWGDNMAFLTTLVNTNGGQWFDMSWKPQLESKPWKDAINFYVDLLNKYGPPGSSANSFNEILALFQPGHLVLTGPRLPHNWISLDVPEGGVQLRDRVIQFHHTPIAKACTSVPELAEVLPLLERARNGIEFFGLSDCARVYFERIKSSRGLERFGVFCQFMGGLARCTDYQLLSSAQLQSCDDDVSLEQINSIVNQLTESISRAPSLSEFAEQFGMSESRFSRFFRRATGNNFIDFVNRVRISRACLLLMESNRYITHICYDVGFNNVANFNRRFLEIKGMTPSEFRRQASSRFGH